MNEFRVMLVCSICGMHSLAVAILSLPEEGRDEEVGKLLRAEAVRHADWHQANLPRPLGALSMDEVAALRAG